MSIKDIFKNKRTRVIIILAFIAVFLLILKLFPIQEVKKEPVPEITPTPKIFYPTLIPTNEPQQGNPNFYENTRPKILENYPLFDYIPYKTANFSIDYLKPLVLEVILKKDTPEIRDEVINWIKSKGVNPKNHEIIWKTK